VKAKRLASLAALLAISGPVQAQGTAADYSSADNLARSVQGKVAHGRIEPVWLGGGSRFWYRSDLGGGRREFILVDPAAATRKPAFDHARLAASLNKALGRTVTSDRLPFDSIAFADNGSSLRFTADRKPWAADLKTYEISPAQEGGPRAGLTPLTSVHPSRSGGEETDITLVNRIAIPLDLFWVDTDGKRVAYGTVAPGASRSQHTFAGHVWLLAKQHGAPVAAFEAAATPAEGIVDAATPAPTARPRRPERRAEVDFVSPDGKLRALIRDYNVVLRDSASGEVHPLTKDGAAGDRYEPPFAWSPDSRRLVVMKTIPAQEHKIYEVESSPTDQEQPKLHTLDYLKPGDRIAHPRPHLFDVAKDRDIPIKDDLFPNPWELSELKWDADSSRFTFLYNQRGHQAMRAIAVDANTGETRALIDEEAKTFIDWTNKVYFYRLPVTHEAIWMSERDGWNHLYLYDMAAGRLKNQVTRGEWVVRKVNRVDPEKRQVWFEAGGILPGQDPYYVHYCRVNLDGTGLTLLTEGDGTHDVKHSPDSKYLVDTWSRVDMPPVTDVRSAEAGKKILELERGDASALLASGWRMPERFTAKGRDGKTDIYGVIFRPSNFDPAKKYPVLENIYAGPQGSFVPKAWSASHPSQAMAELGFIVVQIDGMGTNNRSKAFHDVCWKNLADAGFPDRILWIKSAAAKYPEMNLTRVGLYGTSAGGQSALGGILQYPNFYKASVADCGCHDNRMDKIWWNEQWMGWPIGPEYAANSNVTLAPKLRGKLLLMVGEMDTNVDPASTMQVVNALVKANKDFDLFVMPGAGHGVAGTPYGRRKLRDFFVRALLHVTPPDRNQAN
jgi:dipeptidyl-peptidase-4